MTEDNKEPRNAIMINKYSKQGFVYPIIGVKAVGATEI